jgi:hypothetical protein
MAEVSWPVVALAVLTGVIWLLTWLLQPTAETKPFTPAQPPIDFEECKKRWKKKVTSIMPASQQSYLVIG